MANRDPFPLQWPPRWKRTRSADRAKSKFGVGQSGQIPFGDARSFMLRELELLGAANVVITSDLPTQRNGLPYAAESRTGDVGIAVWFLLADEGGRHSERCFPCDRWRSHAENMWAIGKTVDAMRGLARWGAGDVVTRAFAGFAALPPGATEVVPAAVVRPWREVLGGTWPELDAGELLVLAKARHRKLIAAAHPDAGGNHEHAAELNVAIAAAEAELGG